MFEKLAHVFKSLGFLRRVSGKRAAINVAVILGLGLTLGLMLALHQPLSNSPVPAAHASAPTAYRIIIKMRDEWIKPLATTGYASLDASLDRFDVQAVVPLFDAHSGDVTLKQDLGLDRIYVLTLPSSSNLQDALSAFSADPAVEYAEPDYIGYGAGIPNDQYFTHQWNLHNTGQNGGESDADVDAPEAWDMSLGVTSTVLAIIDTGVDLDHPDLAEKIVEGYSFVTYTVSPQDDHGHGTHVAGIAAAVTSNTIGAAGVCPKCRVMPLKALNGDNWGYYSWWISAIEYAVDNGAHLVNMSMGGVNYSQMLHDAVRYAYSANVPIVAAMMNDGDETLYYPAAFTETIAVGATDRYDDRWSDSNFGDHIDLVAPGAAILSTKWDDTYAIWNGTSMAAPHVVGTLGLINSVRPGYTVEELRAILRATAEDQVGLPNEDKQGWDQYFGSGRLNVAQAVQYVVPPTGAIIDGPTGGLISVGHAFTTTVGPITAAQPITYVWQATGRAEIVHTGGLSDVVVFAWATPGTQTVTVTATNFGGAVAATHVVTITPPPTVTALTVCPGGGCDYDDIQAAVGAIDDDGVIRVAAGTYTGVNSYGNLAQVVYISKSVTIRGGYTTAFIEPPDPAANPTTVDAQGGGRGFYVTGVPASGAGVPASGAGVPASGAGVPASGAGVSLTIEGLRVTGGDAGGLGGGLSGGDVGGGIYVINAGVAIRNIWVFSNTARWGGGVYLWESDAALDGNTITTNTARWGGGLCLQESDATLTGNTITANTVDKDGGGVYLRGGNVTLDGNAVVSNTAGEWGGGLYLFESDATLNGNTVTINTVAKDGGGLYLWKSDATLDGNTVVANTAAGEGGGLYLGNSDATLINNVVADNQADIAGSGLYIRGSFPFLLHTTIARNGGGDGSGVYITGDAGDYSTATLINVILVNHTIGITVADGSTATLEATLWGEGAWANATDWDGAGAITSIHDYWGAPAFVAPDAGDYRIGASSAALDVGVDTGMTLLYVHDIDGDLRPIGAGYDIGADEFSALLRVAQQASPSVMHAGAQLTYTIRVTNTGNVYLHATITDVLPSHVSPGGVRTWTPVLAPGSSWVETVVVAAEMGYTGLLTNVVQVTTEEGAAGVDASAVIVVEELVTVGPSEGGTIVATGPDGMTTTVEIPPGAVTEPTQLAYASVSTVTDSPPGFAFAGRAFILEAYRDGTLTPTLVFEEPVTVTVYYAETDVAGLDENTLELRHWDSGHWSADGITVVERDVVVKRLVAQIERLSEFATFAEAQQSAPPQKIYLPLVLRQGP